MAKIILFLAVITLLYKIRCQVDSNLRFRPVRHVRLLNYSIKSFIVKTGVNSIKPDFITNSTNVDSFNWSVCCELIETAEAFYMRINYVSFKNKLCILTLFIFILR